MVRVYVKKKRVWFQLNDAFVSLLRLRSCLKATTQLQRLWFNFLGFSFERTIPPFREMKTSRKSFL